MELASQGRRLRFGDFFPYSADDGVKRGVINLVKDGSDKRLYIGIIFIMMIAFFSSGIRLNLHLFRVWCPLRIFSDSTPSQDLQFISRTSK